MNKLLGVLLILTSCGASRVATPQQQLDAQLTAMLSGAALVGHSTTWKSRASRPKSATPSTA